MIWVQFPARSAFSFALLSFVINKNKTKNKQTQKQKQNNNNNNNNNKNTTKGKNDVIHSDRLKKKIERRSVGESRHGPPSISSYCPAKKNI